jgi:hypothetical protein
MDEFEVYRLTEQAIAEGRGAGWSLPAEYKIQLIGEEDKNRTAFYSGEEWKFTVPAGALSVSKDDIESTMIYYGVRTAGMRQTGSSTIWGCMDSAGWRENTTCVLEPDEAGFRRYVWDGQVEVTGQDDGVLGMNGEDGGGDEGTTDDGSEDTVEGRIEGEVETKNDTFNREKLDQVSSEGAAGGAVAGAPQVPLAGTNMADSGVDETDGAAWERWLAWGLVGLSLVWVGWFFVGHGRRKHHRS